MHKTIVSVYTITLLGILVWLGLIFWAPYLRSVESPYHLLVYRFFSPLCHQAESRCFWIYGAPLAVCARCLGIYIGFLIGTLTYAWKRGFESLHLPSIKFLILVSVPIIFDTAGNVISLWSTPAGIRLILGLLWGSILPFYLITGIAEFFIHRRSLKKS